MGSVRNGGLSAYGHSTVQQSSVLITCSELVLKNKVSVYYKPQVTVTVSDSVTAS